MHRIEICGSMLICIDTCMSLRSKRAFPNYNKSKLTNRKEMELELPLVGIRTTRSTQGGQWRLKLAYEVDEDR